MEQSTINVEFNPPLLEIKNNYLKFVVAMRDLRKDKIEGVKPIHIADFLLKERWLLFSMKKAVAIS